jgi:Na+-transporting NADH:ubiquinone oxidoreductase subunit C
MKSNFYTIAYAAVLALVCATALTAVNEFTKGPYKLNKLAKKNRETMQVLDIPFNEKASAQEIVDIFDQKVKEDKDKATLYGVKKVYVSGEGENKLWAIQFAGDGMWKPIKGLLCLKADLKTIHRISFYEQEETPGLGAKIAKPKFQNGFRNKTIFDASGKPGVVFKPAGTHSGPNEIDGITGATITSGKVKDMLNKLIDKIANAKATEVSDVR